MAITATRGAARIWYQSFVHPVEQAPYIDRLQGMLDAIASPGIRFEVRGLDPPDFAFHALSEFPLRRASDPQCPPGRGGRVRRFRPRPLPGAPPLIELRGAVDIPVISLGEANMLAALSMAHRFGLVTVNPVFPAVARPPGAEPRPVRTLRRNAVPRDGVPAFMKAFTDDQAYEAVPRAASWQQVKPLIAGRRRAHHSRRRPADDAVRPRGAFRDRRRAGHERHRQWWPRPPKWRWPVRDITKVVVSRRGTTPRRPAGRDRPVPCPLTAATQNRWLFTGERQ
jgi:hypothetical protein